MFPRAFIALKPIMCKKRVFSAKYRVSAHLTSFLRKNAFKRRDLLVLALVSLILHNSMPLHVSQSFPCVKTILCKKRVSADLTSILLKNAFKRREMLVFIKPVFSAKERVLAHLTSFLLKKNTFKRRGMFVSALVSFILHNSRRLRVSQCFHCVKTDNVHKTRFSAK